MLQYADKSTYKHSHTETGRVDSDGYSPHLRITASKENGWQFTGDQFEGLTDHDNETAILSILNEHCHSVERLPTNGEAGIHAVKGAAGKSAGQSWEAIAETYQFHVVKTARWANGYNPDTKAAMKFAAHVKRESAKMVSKPAYRAKMLDKWLAM